MSYEKQTWQTGDVVTSAKLNHMEDGIAAGGGALVVTATYDEDTQTTTLGQTWQTIWDCVDGGGIAVIQKKTSETGINITAVETVASSGETYGVVTASGDTYITDSASGYPAMSDFN